MANIKIFCNVSYDGNLPTPTSFDAAIKWVENNTGYFANNELIALIDFENQKTIFMKLEVTLYARVLQ